ncbi:uncharacterized protein LOC110947746 isoform X3 [Acanthochromis polyacanthus]|uniref:uncharacterized protein LOC110947746 isoform X3 n=1 Tax=Acanthochromis polyacanthus TaxID=80966 RepID=UPI00223414D7|nr:uncharacterized protein LOC110947746 isoform X3 [Acanthochromis polyacanthus]
MWILTQTLISRRRGAPTLLCERGRPSKPPPRGRNLQASQGRSPDLSHPPLVCRMTARWWSQSVCSATEVFGSRRQEACPSCTSRLNFHPPRLLSVILKTWLVSLQLIPDQQLLHKTWTFLFSGPRLFCAFDTMFLAATSVLQSSSVPCARPSALPQSLQPSTPKPVVNLHLTF